MPEIDRRNLSFTQAEGLTPLPGPLALNEFPEQARAVLWNNVYIYAIHQPRMSYGVGGRTWINGNWAAALRSWHVRGDFLPIDEFDDSLNNCVQYLKSAVLSWAMPSLFDLLTFLMRDRHLESAEALISAAFEEACVAYRIADKTIFPVSSEEEGKTIVRAFSDLGQTEYGGARSHLRDAGTALTKGNWADAVRESIHAVESVAKVIQPGSSTLSDALKKLRASGHMNPNLFRGLDALYNYSSDENGIRHAKVFDDRANVDQADAVFMFGACAAFVSFLISRAPSA